MEGYNMERLEKKVDGLCERMLEVKTDMATVLERTTQLQARFEGFANAREATCPQKIALARLGEKADDALDIAGKARVTATEAKGMAEKIQTKITAAKWVWITLSSVIVITGGILGILAATHVI